MIMKIRHIFALICILTISLSSPLVAYTPTANSVLEHITVLADDSLEGRQVGEPGEYKAAMYIQEVFKSAGLEPKGTEGYFQPFDFVKSIDFGKHNTLTVNGVALELNEEYQPMKQSASAPFDFTEIIDVDYGIQVPEDEGTYNDYENKDVVGKAVLIKRFSPEAGDNPHIDFDKYSSLTDKINTAVNHQAGAILFITPENHDDTIMGMAPTNIYPKDVPIIFLRRKGLEKLGLDLTSPQINSTSGVTHLVKTRDTSQNVIGYLPTDNDTTIIIGAHYDHLGWGGPTSLYRGKEKMIHNGADDNASGVAALLELARMYADEKDKLKYSILFLGIAGEEAGLLGANNFASHMTIDSSKIRMMINMDMIGRLKDQDDGLAILGTGTCDEFKSFFDSLTYDGLTLSLKESGTGPSDHTIFYNREIPVLHFYTGAHEDYHKPSDDVDKIDADGIVKVINFIDTIVTLFDRYDGNLTFKKTKDPAAGKRRAQYSVTLSIMPDYVAEVKGLKIDGVTDDGPADRAGLLKDDIIVKMGDIEINDIYDYMNALEKFRKGDTTKVVVERNNEKKEVTVIF